MVQRPISVLKNWWLKMTLWQKGSPAILIFIYWSVLFFSGVMRPDHFTLGCVILGLSYSGPWSRRILKFLLPLFLVAIVYDSQRFFGDLIRARVRVSEPYEFDKTVFGITTASGARLTPNEWLQLHIHPVLDLATGFAYLVFIGVFVLTAGYFNVFCERAKMASRMMWGFFWLNVLGYTTYYWYPAAPPWYVARYGLGPARMDVGPSSAGAVRFDEILGTHFFTEMYGRSADVFGAIPSLHIAYPFLAVIYAFKIKRARTFSLGFFLLMCFSAVYLNHHYVLDILWGAAYTVIIYVLTEAYYRRFRPWNSLP